MNRKKILMIAVPALAVTWLAWYVLARNAGGVLEGSGTVEARNIRVGSKIGGRIAEVRVREGDKVEAGQVLVTFEEKELQAALDTARANLQKLERGYRPEEIAQARAAEAQAAAELARFRHGYRREEIEAARAEMERARANASTAEKTYARTRDLANADIFSKQQRDEAEGAHRAAQAALAAAQQKFAELERGFRSEDIAAADAQFRQAQANRQLMERGFRAEDIAAARAALLDAETRFRERQVLAPAAAVVEVLDVRPGDLIAPNAPVATLLEREQIYIRIYIPATEIGHVHIGQRGEVRVDSFANLAFPAEVEQINQKAEFLPRNVQTRAERVHQVFGVKLRIIDPGGALRPGMAADVKLLPQ